MLRKKIFYIFSYTFFFNFILQLENNLILDNNYQPFSLLAQFENLIISLLLATLYYFSRKSRFKLKIFKLLFIFSLSVAFLNQIFFQMFYESFNLTFIESGNLGDASKYWGSIWNELNFLNFINFFLLLIPLIFFWKKDWLQNEDFQWGREKLFLPILLIISFICQYEFFNSDENKHLAFSLFRGNFFEKEKIERSKMDPKDLYSLKYGRQVEVEQALLSEISKKIEGKKNVIFIILESVGSTQVFKDNKINKEHFPYLYKERERTFSFNQLQNIYPATTRSHLPIMLGGEMLTLGSVYREFNYPYRGTNLVSEFKKKGKETALISAMGLSFGNLDSFYKQLGFDYTYDPDREKEVSRFNSWGVDEALMLEKFESWLDKKERKEFYAQLLTNSTHHPYGAPKNFKHGVKGKTNFDKYRMSMRYTDFIIKELVSILKRRKLEKDTIIFISGDHGEAFGQYHVNSYLHRSSLYEEVLKNFLMIYSPVEELGGEVIQRRGGVGDILPTILSVYNQETNVKGQNLFSPNYKEKISYFYKTTHPEKWGLRDGKWKYIVERFGGKNGALFNLELDSNEQNNIISFHRDREKMYQNLIANWFMHANYQFTSNLKGFKSAKTLKTDTEFMQTYGPKLISVGVKMKGKPFKELDTIHPDEKLTVWTHGSTYPELTPIRYDFISPSGLKNSYIHYYDPNKSTTYYLDPSSSPREMGRWKVIIYNENNKKILSDTYEVSNDQELFFK